MSQLDTRLDSSSASYAENARTMRALVDDLNAELDTARLGGGDDARLKHLKREKMLPRDRVEALR